MKSSLPGRAEQKSRLRLEYGLRLSELNPVGRIKELVRELGRARKERSEGRQRIEELEEENRRLRERMERLEHENQTLRKQLEVEQRAARRQAAPFSRGQPKSHPKRPGRKPGAAYGPRHYRPIPAHVDEEVRVTTPARCPDCGGVLARIFGNRPHSIALSTAAMPGFQLQYSTLTEITDDIDDAREYGGIHFRYDQEAGGDQGTDIRRYVYNEKLG